MLEEPSLAVPEGDVDADEPRVDWEVPEVAAAAVVVAVGLLVLGGLATGIAAAAGAPGLLGPGSGAAVAGTSIQDGAEWAGPLLAMVLLGVVGLCWWQVDRWSGAPDDVDAAEVAGHVLRSQRIARWATGALVLTLAGSIAHFAGYLLANTTVGNHSSFVWSHDIYEAASVLAVAVVASGGIWAAMRLQATPDEEIGELTA